MALAIYRYESQVVFGVVTWQVENCRGDVLAIAAPDPAVPGRWIVLDPRQSPEWAQQVEEDPGLAELLDQDPLTPQDIAAALVAVGYDAVAGWPD